VAVPAPQKAAINPGPSSTSITAARHSAPTTASAGSGQGGIWVPGQEPVRRAVVNEGFISQPLQGPALRLKPGDLASLPAALETIWHITPPFTEL